MSFIFENSLFHLFPLKQRYILNINNALLPYYTNYYSIIKYNTEEEDKEIKEIEENLSPDEILDFINKLGDDFLDINDDIN